MKLTNRLNLEWDVERLLHERHCQEVQLGVKTLRHYPRDLHPDHHKALGALIAPTQSGEVSTLSWLKAAPKSASVKSIKAVLDRLQVVRAISLPNSLRQNISVSALDRLAGEGLRITVQNLRRMAFPAERAGRGAGGQSPNGVYWRGNSTKPVIGRIHIAQIFSINERKLDALQRKR